MTFFTKAYIYFFITEDFSKYLVEDESVSYCKNSNNYNNNNCNKKISDAALNYSLSSLVEKPKSLLMFLINSHGSKFISI